MEVRDGVGNRFRNAPGRTPRPHTLVGVGVRGLQCALAALFLLAGASKFLMPPEAMQADIALPLWFLRAIGALEVLGALGLVLPPLAGIAPRLVPLAAAGLVGIMVGATVLSAAVMGIGSASFPFTVGVLLTLVCYSRRGNK